MLFSHLLEFFHQNASKIVISTWAAVVPRLNLHADIMWPFSFKARRAHWRGTKTVSGTAKKIKLRMNGLVSITLGLLCPRAEFLAEFEGRVPEKFRLITKLLLGAGSWPPFTLTLLNNCVVVGIDTFKAAAFTAWPLNWFEIGVLPMVKTRLTSALVSLETWGDIPDYSSSNLVSNCCTIFVFLT